MLIGLISDTHGLLRPEVFRHFDGVEHILHAGDVGGLEILVELEVLAPVTAVWGNSDDAEHRRTLPELAEPTLEGRRIVVLHGHQVGSPTPANLRAAHAADIIVYGHTHQSLVSVSPEGQWVVNPGAAGPARFNLRPSVALLRLVGESASVQIVELAR